jgi:hypothetical protein
MGAGPVLPDAGTLAWDDFLDRSAIAIATASGLNPLFGISCTAVAGSRNEQKEESAWNALTLLIQ